MKFWIGNMLKHDGHPAEEDLFLYVDGELAGKQAAALARHLDACWRCRVSVEQVQAAISGFVEYRNQVLLATAERPPRGWRGFGPRLGQAAESAAARRGAAARLRQWLAEGFSAVRHFQPPRALVLAAVCVVLTTVVISVLMWIERGAPVSAAELLQRAAAAQQQQLRATPQPVTHQQLALRRRTGNAATTARGELWREAQSARWRQQLADETWRELEQVYRANRWPWPALLSPQAYQQWRQSAALTGEAVTRVNWEGQAALVLKSAARPNAANGSIVEARLTVRQRDWHPLAQTLRVHWDGAEREYEIRETRFEVVSLPALGATFFAALDPQQKRADKSAPATPTPVPVLAENGALATPSATPTATPTGARASETATHPTTAQVAEAELQAQAALQRLNADVGEEVEFVRQPQGVLVRILAESAARKQELLAALRGLPFVTAQVRTRGEAAAETARAAASAQTTPDTAAGAAGDKPLALGNLNDPDTEGFALQDALKKHFRDPQGDQTIDFANRAIAHAGDALAEAWALRRLAERYPPEAAAQLAPAAQQQLQTLLRGNVARLHTRLQRAQPWLRPVIESAASTRCQGGGTLDPVWQRAALALWQKAQQVDRLTGVLLGGKKLPPAETKEKVRALCAALADVQAQAGQLQQQVAQ